MLEKQIVYFFNLKNPENYRRIIYYCCKKFAADKLTELEPHGPGNASISVSPFVLTVDLTQYSAGHRELYYDAVYADDYAGVKNANGYDSITLKFDHK